MSEYDDFETFTEYSIFDCDQHIYEPADCYLQHIPAQYADRTIRPVTVDGATLIYAQDRVLPTDNDFDKCYRPGSLAEMLRSMKAGPDGANAYRWMSIDGAFLDPELRLAQMERQRVDGALMFCGSLGLFAEHLLTDDDVYWASSWSYLRWLDDTWGLARDNRIFTSPVISLRDVPKACEQLDWIFERGGRSISISPGPAYGRSPGDPHFDPIWARVQEAGAFVTVHVNEAMPGYKASRSQMWGHNPTPTFYEQSAWQWMWAYGEVPLMETLSSLIYDNVFGRFPDLRVVSAEHGAEWVPNFLVRMDKMRGMGRNGPWIDGQLTERPSQIFKRHVRVVPYWEDDLQPIIEQAGIDVLIGGSDFPHSEGIAFPTQLVEHLEFLTPAQQKFVMRDNAKEFLQIG